MAGEKNTRKPARREEGLANRRVRILLGIAIGLLLALLLGLFGVFVKLMTPLGIPKNVTAGQQQGFEWVKSLYGYGPAKEQQLMNPTAVAIGPNGDIYATDPVRARIMVFSAAGTFKRVIQTAGGGTGPGKFSRPEAIAVDESGNLFVADSWARKVVMLNSSDRFIKEFPAFAQARGIDVKDGKLYILDIGKVVTFDVATAKPLKHYGERGHGPGEIDAYLGIVTDGKTVYIADSYNRRIDAFDANSGKFLWSQPGGVSKPSLGITSKEVSSTGGLQLPQDITIDGNGRLVLVDAFNFDIAVANKKDGKLTAHFGGEPGTVDGQLYYPTSVAYDPSRDWFAVADTGNNRVQIFRIPDSGNNAGAGVRRLMASPYRYLCFPLVILLLTVIAAVIVGRRMRRADEEEDAVAAAESEQATMSAPAVQKDAEESEK